MYPTLNSNNNVGAPFAYPSPQLGTESRDSRSFASNGPSQLASASSNSNALPVLRVQISEQLCISPPVMISSETGNVPRVEFNQSYDFEHQVLRDFSTDPMPSSVELDESGMLEMQRYTQLGHEREAVIMALLAVTASEDKDSQVLKFIEEYGSLKAMGFAPDVVTGAMIAYPNDIAEATEACIGAS